MELKTDIEQEKANLKTLSECELLETYTRRDNIKKLGLEQNLAHGQRETYQETAEVVQKVAQEMNVRVKKMTFQLLIGCHLIAEHLYR